MGLNIFGMVQYWVTDREPGRLTRAYSAVVRLLPDEGGKGSPYLQSAANRWSEASLPSRLAVTQTTHRWGFMRLTLK
ncbi:MAG: hypothetical protein ABIH24_11240 [Verrucomicrobiota bacterium]